MMLHPSLVNAQAHNNQNKETETSGKQNLPKGEIGWLLNWRDQLPSQSPPPKPNSFKTIEVKDIISESLDIYASNIQALYLNVDWAKMTLQKFRDLNIPDSLLNNGMVFVWVEKQKMDEVMDHLQKFEINYVEIFTMSFFSLQKIRDLDNSSDSKGTLFNFFQKKGPTKTKSIEDYLKMESHQFPNIRADQVICKNSGEWFRKSKRNLLLLRKVNKKQSLQLRHQRTSDIFFTLYDQQKQEMDPKAEQCVYKMIETLLIKANYIEGQQLKMMELWAKPGHSREGWISISQHK